MARLNTRTHSSITGRRALSSISSRANTPTGRLSTTRSITPGSGSEKENPRGRIDKGKARATDSVRLMTPISSDNNGRSRKRRRRPEDGESEDSPASEPVHSDEEDVPSSPSIDDPEALMDVTEDRLVDSAVTLDQRSSPRKKVRFYDPNQPEEERRLIKSKSRALEREFNENRDEYLRLDNDGLARTILRADEIFSGVKQTNDATLDSRLMVGVSDLAHRKSARMIMADSTTGIDLDDFVSKCIRFMRHGPREATEPTSNSHRHRRGRGHEDEDEAGDDALDWSHLCNQACLPYNARPAVTSFLLGPLSVQKRVRAATQRRTRQRDDERAETRPEALQREDLETNETSTVRHICGKIKTRLVQHCQRAEARVRAAVDAAGGEEVSDEDITRIFRKERTTPVGGPSLFDFVVNPDSFGQTVENLFYVSFLIKEGEVGIEMDSDGLPALVPNQESVGEARDKRRGKSQAILSIEYETWRNLKEAFHINQALIPHRDESEGRVGPRGWYN